MAKRRMFSLDIIDTDLFLEMPQSSRLLYYELCMRADDDGFVSSPKKIQKMVGCNEDDFKVLISKQFIIPFDTGIVVIRHWKIHNYIQKDRYKETIYLDEKSQLNQQENGMYTKCIHSCIQNGYTGKDSIELDKDSIELGNNVTQMLLEKEKKIEKDVIELDNNSPASEDKSSTALVKASKHKYGEYKNVLLKDEEFEKLKKEYPNWEELIKYLDEYIEMKGYKAKSHYLCIKKWVVDAVEKKSKQNSQKSAIEEWLNE